MRIKPKNLQLMEILHPRMRFTNIQEKQFLDLKSGFEGECAADAMMDPYLDNCIVINDLCLQANRFCQIDKLIIAPSQIYLLEIKNYGGTFIYKDKQFFNHKMEERDNPFLQLKRTEQQLRMFMAGFNFPIHSRIVTMNPTFHMHGSTLETPLIQFGQLEKFVTFVAGDRKRLTSEHSELARYLRESHQTENRYEQLMPFEFVKLERGVFCTECEKRMDTLTQKKFICCPNCQCVISKKEVIKNALEELNFLLGPKQVKTKVIQEWTGNQINRRSIQRNRLNGDRTGHS